MEFVAKPVTDARRSAEGRVTRSGARLGRPRHLEATPCHYDDYVDSFRKEDPGYQKCHGSRTATGNPVRRRGIARCGA